MPGIKNAELKIKNDGKPGNTGLSGGDPAAAPFKMTFLAVMAEVWHKRGRGCYPAVDCIPLITKYFTFWGDFGGFDGFLDKIDKMNRIFPKGLFLGNINHIAVAEDEPRSWLGFQIEFSRRIANATNADVGQI
jgi:hypothetical protein